MKPIFLFLISLISFNPVFSQSSEHSGSYEFFRGNNDSYYLKDNLTLNPNGTFLFSTASYVEQRMDRKRLQYGKGTWTSDKRLIFLKAEDSDVDATHELNLNNTKLRYDTKSPRDKSNRDIKTSVRIIESEISWLKGRTLIKGATSTPKVNEDKCCKSIWQVHSYLAGKWTKKDEPNKEYHYSFKDEKGTFDAYRKTENGTLEPINEVSAKIKIVKSDSGFNIETDFKGLITSSTIKHLDGNTLITIRRDGKEGTLLRIKE